MPRAAARRSAAEAENSFLKTMSSLFSWVIRDGKPLCTAFSPTRRVE